MSDESTQPEHTCWFCTKGNHDDCMVNIPVSSGEDDCSFSIIHLRCECHKNDHKKQ